MNPIISELIQHLEASPHKVATKEYILDRLRESQRHECEHCIQIPVYDMAKLKDGFKLVKGGS